jgi:hypothetical protein
MLIERKPQRQFLVKTDDIFDTSTNNLRTSRSRFPFSIRIRTLQSIQYFKKYKKWFNSGNSRVTGDDSKTCCKTAYKTCSSRSFQYTPAVNFVYEKKKSWMKWVIKITAEIISRLSLNTENVEPKYRGRLSCAPFR